MKNSNYIIFIISTLLIFSLIGCTTNKDTESVLSSNVLADLNNDKLDIMDLLQRGNDSIQSNDFVTAKSFYEKAIMKDKMNIDTYLKIKDKYLESSRLDDAYYFINLAIDSGVNKDNMVTILDDIKLKFTPIILSSTVLKSSAFALPNKVDISVNNTDTDTSDVTWTDSASTNKVGSFTYNGYCNKYNRTVTYNLTIKENIIPYTHYLNPRFGFSVDYPTFFTDVVEPTNGDGITCTSMDGSIFLTWSEYNVQYFTVKESMDFDKKSNKNVLSYEYLGSNFYILSWEENGTIIYNYNLVGTNQISGFKLRYPKKDLEKYKDIIIRITNSFNSTDSL